MAAQVAAPLGEDQPGVLGPAVHGDQHCGVGPASRRIHP